uniref:Protein SDA1 n=1 Tax=Mesocestoides corti TaxID=53468 RepID=A0A5K3F280_MESCO
MAVAKEAVILLVELYRRNVWKDEKTVNMIADACLAKSKKVFSKAVRFFLGHNEKSAEQDSSSDSDDNVDMNTRIKQMKLGHRVGIKSKKRAKRLDRSIENLRRKNERKKKEQMPTGINVPALNLIYDPQTFAERLFHKLEKCNDRLEIRLLLLELISHLIGIHQLLLLNFYPSLQRFLRPQQREITRLLLFAAQASHDQVPPDAILPLVRTITDNFVTDRASAEAITVGLNTIREICARCPYAVDEDLLSDLVEYKSYRNKNVVAAARSLIRLYRQRLGDQRRLLRRPWWTTLTHWRQLADPHGFSVKRPWPRGSLGLRCSPKKTGRRQRNRAIPGERKSHVEARTVGKSKREMARQRNLTSNRTLTSKKTWATTMMMMMITKVANMVVRKRWRWMRALLIHLKAAPKTQRTNLQCLMRKKSSLTT